MKGETIVDENGNAIVYHTEWMLENRPELIVE